MIFEDKIAFIPRMGFHKRNKEKGDFRNRKLSGTETVEGKTRCWGLGTSRVIPSWDPGFFRRIKEETLGPIQTTRAGLRPPNWGLGVKTIFFEVKRSKWPMRNRISWAGFQPPMLPL